jgi:hypothetical protein
VIIDSGASSGDQQPIEPLGETDPIVARCGRSETDVRCLVSDGPPARATGPLLEGNGMSTLAGGLRSGRRLSLPGMTSIGGNQPDPPACPLLGLAADRRSHFTYPHPGHRCFAKAHPATTDARRQTTYCLNVDFPTCDRFLAWKRRAETDRQHESPSPNGVAPGEWTRTDTGDAAPGATAIYVFRDGDSVNRIAAKFGVTAAEIMGENGLIRNEVPADGTRLVIPLRSRPVALRRAR